MSRLTQTRNPLWTGVQVWPPFTPVNTDPADRHLHHGEQATEVIHVGLIARLAGAGAAMFNQACFNYPTLGDLYKYATYDAILQRGGISSAKSPAARASNME